jgi:UDP-GlcNAc3NAcA epimerase
MVDTRPDAVLVYGDTNSTLAGALAAAKLHLRAAHVEAGLRSFNRRMPEEINRVVADHTCDVLFAPTAAAVDNLHREGLGPGGVYLVGDVMYDAALHYAEAARRRSTVLERLGLAEKGYVLATLHRAENTDDRARLAAILAGLAGVARLLPVVLPLHPRTRAAVSDEPALTPAMSSLRVVDPVGYLDMVMLERGARVIATDSGGVQKEAFFHRVPCVTLRGETEWVELVELGWNRLCRPDSPDAVTRTILGAMDSGGREASPYGDGDAARRIAAILAGR